MKYKNIFFDWNGTLFDDAYASFSAVNAILDNRKLPKITFEQYREYIDVPVIRFYERVMDVSKENIVELYPEFNEKYEKYLPPQPLFSGLQDLLEKLCELGIKLYIFSSSHTDIINGYLNKFDLSKYFVAVLGANDYLVESKIDRTSEFIKHKGIVASETVFIGDMVHDSDVSRIIGSDCILISSGHQSRDALIASGNKVVSSVAELFALICK